MVYEDVCASFKLIELPVEGFDPLLSVPAELRIAFDPGKAVAEGVVHKTKFAAKLRDNITEPRVEVFEVLQHMRTNMGSIAEHRDPKRDLSPEFNGNFVERSVRICQTRPSVAVARSKQRKEISQIIG